MTTQRESELNLTSLSLILLKVGKFCLSRGNFLCCKYNFFLKITTNLEQISFQCFLYLFIPTLYRNKYIMYFEQVSMY